MRTGFDPEKAIEAIIYVAPKVGRDMYQTLKLLYLADKIHLEKYGSFISGERYAALPYGPVPSRSYDIVKYVREQRQPYPGTEHAVNAFEMHGNHIIPLREADLDVFSRSDISCMDEAISRYGHLSFGELKKLTHDDAYEATPQNGMIALEAIASTLPNAADVIQHLRDPYPEAIVD